ncbi:MAG: hypothetical protein BGO88_15540 [Flavobacterium sp. 38-13]|uniref:DUF4261 domain-containing protein n=1 Tax=Flavobacterium sp. 38-13 TaxID=1896168 RepID=UPI0009698164|nr:DUF4261 domain-containing protein [Flavobacterium sp. 38-13]OJX49643.1 MAG: hypothetical protein BGO88_15540 [Flavobacterium sp. 38-13]
MGFFTKKEKKEETAKSNLLLAMPMFNNGERFDIDKVIAYLQSDWGIDVTDIDKSTEAASFSVQGETVVLATVAAQIPMGDIQGTAQYAYNWPTAVKDLENHNVHGLVTILSSNTTAKERFGILTKVLTAILATSNCIGVYQGTQSLLIPKAQYLDSAEALKSNQIPLDLWIYIGIRRGEQTNSAYSYGLTAFDKLEMEFVNAPLGLRELHTFLSQICAYVINSNVTFKSGETLGYTAEQKIKITQSKGKFVEGESFKLEL